MVAALTLAFMAAAASGPVAAFSASSPVRVGETVTYIDHSYDPVPGDFITLRIWIGRQGSFSSPGSYPVTLEVMDDRGAISNVTHAITVVNPAAPVRPQPQDASLTLSSSTLRRGDSLTVRLTDASAAQDIQLALPGAFLEAVSLPTGSIDYASINKGVFTLKGGVWSTTVWVPWTIGSPADGNYGLTVSWTVGGSRQSLHATFTISGSDRLAVWAQD